MAITMQETVNYVTAMARAELVVRPILRRLGLKLRDRVMMAYKNYDKVLAGLTFIFETESEVEELANALTYSYLLGDDQVRQHFENLSIAMAINYSRSKGVYGAVNQATVNSLKRIFKSKAIAITKDLNEKADKAIRQVILRGISNNSSQEQITRNLTLLFKRLGITGQTKYTIANIARTQTQIAFNAGKWNDEHSDEFIDSLWGYRYETVGDDRVRPEHELIDGVTLPKGSPFWTINYPPNGYNCRCQAIALFRKAKVVRPPSEYLGPDKDFEFNPGLAFPST